MNRPETLGAEDAAWLNLDDATNPMVISGLLELGAPWPFERARAVLARLAELPRFRSRVAPPASPHAPWALPHFEPVAEFRLDDHVVPVALPDGSEATLRGYVSQLVSGGLDRTRPLWRIDVVERPRAGTTVIFRVHHALGDGFALLDVLLSLCDHAPSSAPPPRREPPPPPRLGAFAGALRRLVTLPPDPPTVLKLPLQTEKHVAWSRPLSLLAIKAAARATGATVNDVLTALVAGALGRHLERQGTASDVCEIHAMVPVDLRPRAAPSGSPSARPPRSLDNQFGLVLLALPIGIRDPVARVHAVRERMRALKATPEAKVAHDLLCVLGRTPSPARDLAATFFGKKASVVLTNVPGPRQSLTIDGVALERVVFWVPEAVRIGLGISIFSYGGAVTIGVLADASAVRDPTVLAADVEAELAELQELLEARLAGESTSGK